MWVSKLQTEIALSTTEAEYIALSQSMRDLLPMKALFQEVGNTLGFDGSQQVQSVSTVFEDNNGALSMATSKKMLPRTKHLAIKYHFFKQYVEDGTICLEKIHTDEQKADIFTKGLSKDKFEILRELLLGWWATLSFGWEGELSDRDLIVNGEMTSSEEKR